MGSIDGEIPAVWFLISSIGFVILTFLFCSIFGNNIGGSFDRGEYKLWVKENIQGAIYLSLLLYTLLNTAAIFVFGQIFLSIMVYFILFTAIFLWDKHQKKE